jgi:hypothetical protein
MTDPNLNLGVGGGSPPLGGPSFEDDEKALKKGRGWVLVAGIIAALVVVAGLIFVLASEQPDQYGTIGRQINGIRQDHFDGFWMCALPDEQLDRLRTDRNLRDAIHARARRAPAPYAQHIRNDCLVKLNEHGRPLRELIPPDDLRGKLAELETSIDALRVGWEEYLLVLDRTTAEDYDPEAMDARLNKIAKGWFDYKNTHIELNNEIREHLGR